jgi:hypothetical protein
MTQYNGADPNTSIDMIANDAANFAKASLNIYQTCHQAFSGMGDSRSNVQSNPFGSNGFGGSNNYGYNNHPAYGYGYGEVGQMTPNPYLMNANPGGYPGFYDPGYGVPDSGHGFGGFY